MILAWLVLIPLLGGLLAWIVSGWSAHLTRWVALAAMVLELALAASLWSPARPDSAWLAEVRWPWIAELGTSVHLAMDGLSLLMVLLTAFLGVVAVAVSWSEVKERVGFFHLNLLFVLGGIVGVFLAMDLLLFYFCWELMLVPMYFLIAVWGHENRRYAAIKFFVFTQLSGLLMLLAILGLHFAHLRSTGVHTFDYAELLGTALSSYAAKWLLLGFAVAFAVKLPVVPLHAWLPDAHTEAPTAGSVILAGLLLKTGAYGLLRFAVSLFPEAAAAFAPLAMLLGVLGIVYGAFLAFAQTDLKRLVAYTSVSHLGFVLLGVGAWNRLALQGAVVQMISHGLSTGALFVLVGALQSRLGTRDVSRLGGLAASLPRLGAVTLFFALASLGLPGLGNFVGEFLVLLGAYQANVPLAIAATVGLVVATVYSLWMMHAVFFGPVREARRAPDLGLRELAVTGAMMVALLWLGLFPQPVLNTADAALQQAQEAAESTPERTVPPGSVDSVMPRRAAR